MDDLRIQDLRLVFRLRGIKIAWCTNCKHATYTESISTKKRSRVERHCKIHKKKVSTNHLCEGYGHFSIPMLGGHDE